jgi:hypothetical protein
MNRRALLHTCLSALCALVALSLAPSTIAQSANPTVSYLYLSSPTGIYGYDIAGDGSLKPISGSPFHTNLYASFNLANNGTFLFAVRDNGQNFGQVINSFKIQPNGALKLTAQTNISNFNFSYKAMINLFLDKKGETLYGVAPGTFDQAILSFGFNPVNGILKYLGAVPYVPELATPGLYYFPPKFLGNDKYLYTGDVSQTIYGWVRTSNGSLVKGPNSSDMPLAPAGYSPLTSLVAAADPANLMAFTFIFQDSAGNVYGPEQIGIYSADSLGNLSTTGTYLTMPKTSLGANGYFFSYDMKFSPSGKLLALSGERGLQIFHFDGTTVTPYTGVLLNTPVYEFRWDNYNHLVAFERDSNRLHVLNVTPTSVKEAPGSPYTMPVGEARFTIQNLPL